MDDRNSYLKLKKDFDNFWLSSLYPFLKEKEDLRKKYLSRFWFLILLAVFVLPFCAIGIYTMNKYFSTDIDPAFFYILCALCIFIFQVPYRIYKKKIKYDVMPKFISFFGGFSYQPGKGLSVPEIEESHIFPAADEYEADDCFVGSWQGVTLRICEQTLKKIRRGKHKTQKKTVFQGIAIDFELNKTFRGETIVLKDSGFLNKFKTIKGFERVGLEDPQFEKMFEVYATNQVEARYLLNPVFMEQVVKLKDLYKGKSVQLYFSYTHVLIAIDTKQDMFEPYSFFKTNLNKKKIDLVFEEFITVFSIIDILRIAKQQSA